MTTIKSGDKVARDVNTHNSGTVRLGEAAPTFIKSGDKVVRDTATANSGAVRLGEAAPAFIKSGDKVARDTATANSGAVRLGPRLVHDALPSRLDGARGRDAPCRGALEGGRSQRRDARGRCAPGGRSRQPLRGAGPFAPGDVERVSPLGRSSEVHDGGPLLER